MVDILVFLFESYIQANRQKPSFETLSEDLENAGFDQTQIVKAFTWLEGLKHYEKCSERLQACTPGAKRHYTNHEYYKLGPEGIEFIRYLDENHLTSDVTREMIIDRAIAVGRGKIAIEHLKWISLIILCYKNPENKQIRWYENFIFENSCHKTLH